MPVFSSRSEAQLTTCHPDLQRVFNELIKTTDCTVIQGHRNKEDQNDAFERGVTRAEWPNSKHNAVPSQAADVMPFPVKWGDEEGIAAFADKVLATAIALGVKLVWGGSWKTLSDRDHYELA